MAMGAPQQMSYAPGIQYGGSLTAAPGITTVQAPSSALTTGAAIFPWQQQGGVVTQAAPMAVQQSPRLGGSMTMVPGMNYGGSLNVAPGGFPGGIAVGGGSARFAQAQGGVPMFGGSYTAAPQQYGSYAAPPPPVGLPVLGAGPSLGGGSTMPQANVTTVGIPTPAQVSVQQAAYSNALDKQLAEGIATLEKERELEKQMLKFSTDKDIALYTNVAMERLVEASALVDEKMTFAVLELKKAATERKLQLNAQANGLTMDYEMKTVQVEWRQKWTAFEQQYVNAEGKLEAEYARQVAIANTGTNYAAPVPVLR